MLTYSMSKRTFQNKATVQV